MCQSKRSSSSHLDREHILSEHCHLHKRISQPTEIIDGIMKAMDTGDLPFAWHVTLSDFSVYPSAQLQEKLPSVLVQY